MQSPPTTPPCLTQAFRWEGWGHVTCELCGMRGAGTLWGMGDKRVLGAVVTVMVMVAVLILVRSCSDRVEQGLAIVILLGAVLVAWGVWRPRQPPH